MAIFHLDAKIISRGKGQSAIAAAAYRSGDKLFDEQTDEKKFYQSRAERIQFTDIMAPKDAPEWAHDRNQLWNQAERAEKRKDAQVAREFEISLPHELTDQQREWLTKDFAREAFVRKGYAVDIAIHAPEADSDDRNYHAHLMVTMRTLGPDGFAANKDRSLNSPGQLTEWREQWANLANRHLERHGHEARVDHRSLKAQGVDREPTVHVGYAGMEMDARGAQSDRMDALQEVLERNTIRVEIKALDGELAQLARAADDHSMQQPTAPVFERSEAVAARQKRFDAKFAADQDSWRDSVDRRNPEKIEPAAAALEVVDGATGAISKLGDFMLDLFAGSSAKPAPPREPDMAAFVSDPQARKAYQLAQLAAAHEKSEGEKALDRIRVDWENGRKLKAEDIRHLTHQHQTAVFNGGDDAVRQLVEEARKRQDEHSRSDGRERER